MVCCNPKELPVGDLVTEIIERQGFFVYNIPQGVVYSPNVPEDGHKCCTKYVELIWIDQ